MKNNEWAEEADNHRYVPPFVRQLMKGATEAEIQQATDNLRAYIKALYAMEKSIGVNMQKKEEPN